MKNIKNITFKVVVMMVISLQSNARCVICWHRSTDGAHACIVAMNVSCSDGPVKSGSNMTLGNVMFGCVDFMLSNPNGGVIIKYDKMNRAVIDDHGTITTIASDKLESAIKKHLGKKELEKFLDGDDGFVSKKRLLLIAKELNAKLILTTKLPVANNCPLCKEMSK